LPPQNHRLEQVSAPVFLGEPGTSVDQIDRTYGHLLPDALDRTRTALDAFTAATDADAVIV
jgi:hypothetical protein